MQALGEQQDNHGTTVSTDNGDGHLVRVHACNGGSEAHSADDIKGGDAKHMFGVICTSLDEHGCDNGYGGVDGVGDDEDMCFGGDTTDSTGKVMDDGCVGL